MQAVFEKIVEKLEKLADEAYKSYCIGFNSDDRAEYDAYINAIEIVKQEADQYKGGWIPCSDRLPEEAFGCLVTVIDCNPVTQKEFENILPYVVGYDGNGWNDIDGETIPFEVIAWMPQPEPYKEGEKHE